MRPPRPAWKKPLGREARERKPRQLLSMESSSASACASWVDGFAVELFHRQSGHKHQPSTPSKMPAQRDSRHTRFLDVDNTPPAYLAVTAPYDGAQVSGVVTLSATGSDNMERVSIAFQVDGNTLTPFATTAPYTGTWNSTGLSGTHTIVATAYDRAGDFARSAPVTVTVP
ncbi:MULTISPECIES: Ig-like domain-containing protein [Corallococcus]|uniref:Ig-like domain-containing protein n=1 Tax=Corallococcus TaxID=83461 RepID=UPI0011C4908B|nr:MULTISPECIES: Ig-like domain-containing protein [Corallococcus]